MFPPLFIKKGDYVNLQNITEAANIYTDETYTDTQVMFFVNEAISKINIELGCSLPLFKDSTTDYTALSDSWITSLFIPYAAYSIKLSDGSLNEANMFLQSFNDHFLNLIENKYKAIKEEYRLEDFDGVYRVDNTQGINIGWFNKGGYN